MTSCIVLSLNREQEASRKRRVIVKANLADKKEGEEGIRKGVEKRQNAHGY